jgi:alpha-beta hydrolase superfamily lysophospholipase
VQLSALLFAGVLSLFSGHDEQRFDGAAGVKIYEQCWVPDSPKAVMLVVHGLKDHGSRYGELAKALGDRGVATCAIDLPGHGKSEGERVFPSSFDEYVDDVRMEIGRLQTRFAGKPVFLFGHSMGGAIVTLYTVRDQPPLAGLVLSGAALETDAPAGQVKLLRKVAPKHPQLRVLKLKTRKFSRDKAVLREMKHDPLVDRRKVPARVALGILDAIAEIHQKSASLTVPLLAMHGAADEITVPAGSKALVAKAGSTDKTFKPFPGLYHDLVHEPEKAQVITTIADWVAAHVPAQAPPPEAE